MVERKSGGVLVYDVRVSGKVVAWLEGREAWTNQRLGVDIYETEKGIEVWAGGIDGVVRVWEGVGQSEGPIKTSWEWKAHDGEFAPILARSIMLTRFADPVTSTVVHSSGTVVATCSGQRSEPKFDDSESESEESGSDEDSEDSGSNNGSEVESSTSSPPAMSSRTPDNSIKIWSL